MQGEPSAKRKTFKASRKQKPAKEETFIFDKRELISIDRKPKRISSNQITFRSKKQDQEDRKNQIRRKKIGQKVFQVEEAYRKTFWASRKQKPAKEETFISDKPGLISKDRTSSNHSQIEDAGLRHKRLKNIKLEEKKLVKKISS